MAKNKRRRGGGADDFQVAEAERRFTLAVRRMELVEKLGKPFIVMVGLVAIVYFGIYMPIEASRGQKTIITFVLKWIGDFNVHVALAWGSTVGCCGWAITERKKRLREREERDDRIKKLEMQLDPNRSSSNLTTDGTDSRRAQDDG